MNESTFEEHVVNGIRMRVAQQGSGPLVLFCHGWPESWYSWRHQMAALAAAGYRAVAPDMRGYGGTEAPPEIERYTLLHLVGDMVELLEALGETQAVIVGHDWGAPVAWHAALLRPDRFRAVVGMSVPFSPPSKVEFLSLLKQRGIENFYMQYFQAPGVAEAEFEADVEAALRRIYFSGSGDAPERVAFGLLPPGQGFLANTVDPETLPPWLSRDDIAYYTGEFKRAGFRGGLNWYRNLKRSWELLAPWRGCIIKQPALFIAGARDGVLRFPASKSQIENFKHTLPGLRGCHILEGAGHWIQRERAAEVNALLLGFLKSL
jgi:pimeloyl-ACP methyl ester carboxylesterase